ncbi:MAG: endolytic transglycosylase MltG [Lachnospiraceae bacterium]|nr:endolytic transglycosylase MltG [Lachnospiraceae bacterium]
MKKGKGSFIMRLLMRFSLTILIVGINVIFYVFVFNKISDFAGQSYDITYRVFGDQPMATGEGRDVRVTILKGESTMNIASKLADAKLIPDKYSFYLKLKLKDYEIMPGTFVLNTSMTYNDILDAISSYSNSVDKEQSVEDLESKI